MATSKSKKQVMPKVVGSKSKKEPMPKVSGSNSKKVIMPKLNEKKVQDMLTGRKSVTINGKKPKTGEALKEAIRKKTGVFPNTAN